MDRKAGGRARDRSGTLQSKSTSNPAARSLCRQHGNMRSDDFVNGSGGKNGAAQGVNDMVGGTDADGRRADVFSLLLASVACWRWRPPRTQIGFLRFSGREQLPPEVGALWFHATVVAGGDVAGGGADMGAFCAKLGCRELIIRCSHAHAIQTGKKSRSQYRTNGSPAAAVVSGRYVRLCGQYIHIFNCALTNRFLGQGKRRAETTWARHKSTGSGSNRKRPPPSTTASGLLLLRKADEISCDRCPTRHKIGRLFAFHEREGSLQSPLGLGSGGWMGETVHRGIKNVK